MLNLIENGLSEKQLQIVSVATNAAKNVMKTGPNKVISNVVNALTAETREKGQATIDEAKNTISEINNIVKRILSDKDTLIDTAKKVGATYALSKAVETLTKLAKDNKLISADFNPVISLVGTDKFGIKKGESNLVDSILTIAKLANQKANFSNKRRRNY